MREIEFGTPEHVAGLSREALEADFRWLVSRNDEVEGICERLIRENYELRKLVRDLIDGPLLYAVYHGDEDLTVSEGIEWAKADMRRRARELGVEFFGAEVGA